MVSNQKVQIQISLVINVQILSVQLDDSLPIRIVDEMIILEEITLIKGCQV